jgi:intergrase/recombinase
LIDENILFKLRKKIKLNIVSNIDTYVPCDIELNNSLLLINKLKKEFNVFYKLILESGCRPAELCEMLLNFDPKNIEYADNIVVYRNFYLRKSKNSFYLFFTKETFDKLLHLELSNFNQTYYNSFKERIVRDKSIISLKYLQKYQFTQMIGCGVEFSITNFIQGRSSKDIGFNHYLAKKELALKKYEKIFFNKRNHFLYAFLKKVQYETSFLHIFQQQNHILQI